MSDTPKPNGNGNGKSKFREEFISWNTVKHFMVLLGALLPVLAAVWAWSSAAQAQTVEIATTLNSTIQQNCADHQKYERLIEMTSAAVADTSSATQRVTVALEQHLAYERENGAKLDKILTKQAALLGEVHRSVIELQVQQRLMKEQLERLNR